MTAVLALAAGVLLIVRAGRAPWVSRPVRAAGIVLLAGFGLGLAASSIPPLIAFTTTWTSGMDHLVAESQQRSAALLSPLILAVFAAATSVVVVLLLLRALNRPAPPLPRPAPEQDPPPRR